MVLFHQVLGKGLARLDQGSVPACAEYFQPVLLEKIDNSEGEGEFRSHHRQVDPFPFGKSQQPGQIINLEVDILRQFPDAGIAGGTVDLRYQGGLGYLPDQGMFAAAAADYQISSWLILQGKRIKPDKFRKRRDATKPG